MFIRIQRSGGFAGTIEPLGTIDTRSLPADETARIARSLDLLARVAAQPGDYMGADTYRYDVEVIDGSGIARLLTVLHSGEPDEPLPEPLAALLASV